MLKLRRILKRKKPRFIRQGGKSLKRLRKKWRAPKGSQSKLRKHKKSRGFIPHPGYGSPKSVRGLHPSGFREILVYNINDLNKINPKIDACRIGKTVGKKKKLEIMKKAEEMKIKVLNPLKIEKKAEEKPKKAEKVKV